MTLAVANGAAKTLPAGGVHRVCLSGPVLELYGLQSVRALVDCGSAQRIVLDLSEVERCSTATCDALQPLANAADSAGVQIELLRPSATVRIQLRCARLHRRLHWRSDTQLQVRTQDDDVLALAGAVERDAEHVVRTLRTCTPPLLETSLRWLAGFEDALYQENAIAPYRDLLPAVLPQLDTAAVAAALETAALPLTVRLLFGDYTELSDAWIAEVVGRLRPDTALDVFDAMTRHPDLMRRIGGIVRSLPSEHRQDLEHARPSLAAYADADQGHQSEGLSETAWAPDRIHAFAPGHGTRTAQDIGVGRHVHIDEVIEGPRGYKRCIIDLLELDPHRAELRTYVSPEQRPAFATFERMFARYDETGQPSQQTFRDAGLFRLGEAGAREGAAAAINGGFYFDYGHYTNGKTLGLDFATSDALRFGDPIGWFVRDGAEISMPVFNRSALVIGEHGTTIARVKLVALAAGRCSITWAAHNRTPRGHQRVLFNSLWGLSTPRAGNRVDVVIAEHRVTRWVRGGGATIPFTGVVLSLRDDDPTLQLLREGAPLRSVTNAPRAVGRVLHAVACGPRLMENGVCVVDFDAEDFGRKDSSVISFFLPRLTQTYEAARSFVGVREDGTVVLGAVSGRAFGDQSPDASEGMTFGELAILAQDLGLKDAMGLDGGGSSSLDIAGPEGMQTLNVPTGGSDVPRGAERFIANGLLVFPKT